MVIVRHHVKTWTNHKLRRYSMSSFIHRINFCHFKSNRVHRSDKTLCIRHCRNAMRPKWLHDSVRRTTDAEKERRTQNLNMPTARTSTCTCDSKCFSTSIKFNHQSDATNLWRLSFRMLCQKHVNIFICTNRCSHPKVFFLSSIRNHYKRKWVHEKGSNQIKDFHLRNSTGFFLTLFHFYIFS